MIATGIDVKAIECLLFMRDVRSRNYFEQMKGCRTRILGKEDLQKLTPGISTNKDIFGKQYATILREMNFELAYYPT